MAVDYSESINIYQNTSNNYLIIHQKIKIKFKKVYTFIVSISIRTSCNIIYFLLTFSNNIIILKCRIFLFYKFINTYNKIYQ